MSDNGNRPQFIIKNSQLYLECGEDGFHRITTLRKWVPRHGPEYFDIWVKGDEVIVGHLFETPFFRSTISQDGFLEIELPGNFFYTWLGPTKPLTMNEAIGPAVEDAVIKIDTKKGQKFVPDPLEPLERGKPRPITAEVLRRLLAADGFESLWLPFPQRMCCFSFGPNRNRPLPIGALFRLWSVGQPFVQYCPECVGWTYMVSFGGLLASGGGYLVCIGCGHEFFQALGGFPLISRILEEGPLKGSEFQYTGMKFGGVYPSDGAELCAFLGMEPPPDDEIAGEVYFKIDPPAENEKNHEED